MRGDVTMEPSREHRTDDRLIRCQRGLVFHQEPSEFILVAEPASRSSPSAIADSMREQNSPNDGFPDTLAHTRTPGFQVEAPVPDHPTQRGRAPSPLWPLESSGGWLWTVEPRDRGLHSKWHEPAPFGPVRP